MVKIGDLTIISAYSLIIPPGKAALIDFDFEGDRHEYSIRFINEGGQGNSLDASIDIMSSGPTKKNIMFYNWDNPIGTSLNEPQLISKSISGKSIFFIVAHWRIGKIDRLDLQLMAQS